MPTTIPRLSLWTRSFRCLFIDTTKGAQGLRHFIHRAHRHTWPAGSYPANRHPSALANPILSNRLDSIIRAGRLVPAADKARGQRMQVVVIPIHGSHKHRHTDLPGRRPSCIQPRKQHERGDKKRQYPETGSYAPIPHCGHFTLACNRLLPQFGHGTRIPCGRENR